MIDHKNVHFRRSEPYFPTIRAELCAFIRTQHPRAPQTSPTDHNNSGAAGCQNEQILIKLVCVCSFQVPWKRLEGEGHVCLYTSRSHHASLDLSGTGDCWPILPGEHCLYPYRSLCGRQFSDGYLQDWGFWSRLRSDSKRTSMIFGHFFTPSLPCPSFAHLY